MKIIAFQIVIDANMYFALARDLVNFSFLNLLMGLVFIKSDQYLLLL